MHLYHCFNMAINYGVRIGKKQKWDIWENFTALLGGKSMLQEKNKWTIIGGESVECSLEDLGLYSLITLS